MKNNNKSVPNTNGASATTTEELIVQYLDGELVRKELETVLFDRLSQSEEARMLLREYLVVRGAIRVSRSDKQFQLSDDLDARTRARIEQIMVAMENEELLVPAVALAAPIAKRGFVADKAAVASSPMARQLKRWQVRGSLAAFALLLAVGAVWLVSGNSDDRRVAGLQPTQNPSLNSSASNLVQSQPAQSSVASVVGLPASTASLTKTHAAAHHSASRNSAMRTASNQLAQNPAQDPDAKMDEPASTQEASDPAAAMISHRYTKAIDASKNEVVVTGHDRL
jgi:hypothetical protein